MRYWCNGGGKERATVEPEGIRTAELEEQISEVKLPELFWDERRGAEEHQGMNLKSLEVKISGF